MFNPLKNSSLSYCYCFFITAYLGPGIDSVLSNEERGQGKEREAEGATVQAPGVIQPRVQGMCVGDHSTCSESSFWYVTFFLVVFFT